MRFKKIFDRFSDPDKTAFGCSIFSLFTPVWIKMKRKLVKHVQKRKKGKITQKNITTFIHYITTRNALMWDAISSFIKNKVVPMTQPLF